MIATVNVRLYYQPHCPECMRQVEETISSAIRDASVAGVSMVAANKCEHDALAAPRLAGSAPKLTAPKPSSKPTETEPHIPGLAAAHINGFDAGVN
jgi:hypothetical protein